MSRPRSAPTFFTTSMISAWGPAVTPTRMVSAWAVVTSKAAAARVARKRIEVSSFRRLESAVPQPAVDPARQIVTGALDELHQRDQHDHDGEHHLRHEALVAVADAEITQAAAADR